jgi:hypothetical protein
MMGLLNTGRILFVALLFSAMSSTLAFAGIGFEPVQMQETNEKGFILVRVVIGTERALLVEGRLFEECIYLPTITLLRELQIEHKLVNNCLSLSLPEAKEPVELCFKDNTIKNGSEERSINGWLGENDYYLALNEWIHLIGIQPDWYQERLEAIFPVFNQQSKKVQEDKGEENIETGKSRPFQPFNRLDLFLDGRADGLSYGEHPNWDCAKLGLDWRSYGVIFSGRLVLGGDLEWWLQPNHEFSSPFNVYKWEKDTPWGRLTIGTQSLEFRQTVPILWEMRGVSLTDAMYWDREDWTTDVIGYSDVGNRAELWVDDYIYSTTRIEDDRFIFEDVWLPLKKAKELVILIKDEDTVIGRQIVTYVWAGNMFFRGEQQYVIAAGETNYEDKYHKRSGAAEWIRGWNDDLTAGGTIVVTDEDELYQYGLNLVWRPQKNLVLQTNAWSESSESAWRLGSNWGLGRYFLQGVFYHRDAGFEPIFPSQEDTNELNLAQLALYWYPKAGWEGIVAGEFVNEYIDCEVETSCLETGLSYRQGKWYGSSHIKWQKEDSEVGQWTEQNRYFTSLTWDFVPNQWLEWGIDYNKTNYKIVSDDSQQDTWFRWTNNSIPKNRLTMELGRNRNNSFSENRLEVGWNHLWTPEWNSFAEVKYDWGETLADYDRWTWLCGFEYRMTRGLNVGLGYEWSVTRLEAGEKEYRQGIWLQASLGLLLDSSGATVVPFGNEDRTTGIVTGCVYHDVNLNGLKDRNEPGISGIRVILDNLSTSITDSDGKFIFFNVSTGIHRIGVDLLTLPVIYNLVEHNKMIHVAAGASFKLDLGLRVVGGVSGRVFLDSNKNGVYDDGEILYPGVRIRTEREDVWTTSSHSGDYYLQLTFGEHILTIDPDTLPAELKSGSPAKVIIGDDGQEIVADLAIIEKNNNA